MTGYSDGESAALIQSFRRLQEGASRRHGIPVPVALLQEVADFLVALREGVYKTDSEFRVLLERLEIYI